MTERVAGLILIASNVVVWALVRKFVIGGFSVEDRWQAQMALVQALLLFDTLVIVWRYTIAAERQADATAHQVGLTRDEIRNSWLARWQDNKPVVFTDRRDPGDEDADLQIVVRNVGGGLAVNVFAISPGPDGKPLSRSIGALSAGGERALSYYPAQSAQHVIVAEGVRTRTRRWNPTLNALARGGEMVHRLAYVTSDDPEAVARENDMELEEYLSENWDRLWKELYRRS